MLYTTLDTARYWAIQMNGTRGLVGRARVYKMHGASQSFVAAMSRRLTMA